MHVAVEASHPIIGCSGCFGMILNSQTTQREMVSYINGTLTKTAVSSRWLEGFKVGAEQGQGNFMA